MPCRGQEPSSTSPEGCERSILKEQHKLKFNKAPTRPPAINRTHIIILITKPHSTLSVRIWKPVRLQRISIRELSSVPMPCKIRNSKNIGAYNTRESKKQQRLSAKKSPWSYGRPHAQEARPRESALPSAGHGSHRMSHCGHPISKLSIREPSQYN